MSTFIRAPPSPKVISQSPNQPRLTYYITRSNGSFVPLVPADELPFNVRFQGIPRVLNSDQIFGLQHVATLPYTGCVFKLETDATAHQRSLSQPSGTVHTCNHSNGNLKSTSLPDNRVHPGLGDCNSPDATAGPSRPVPMHELATNWRKAPTSDPQAVIDAIIGTKSGAKAAAEMGYSPKTNGVPSPSGNVPDQEKKEHCTYWIRHGECDYMQQGCLYKHEMPDQATLRKIGFRSTPRWWLEKTQAVRLGGERATVGPVVKSSVWLNSASAGELNSDASGSDASNVASTSSKSTYKEERHKVETNSPDTSSRSTTPGSPNTWPFSIRETKERKHSAVSDLIDFKPLLPTPTSSESSSGTVSSSDISTHVRLQNASRSGVQSRRNMKTKKPRAKVFVPVGEDPETHIAEAEKKAVSNQKTIS